MSTLQVELSTFQILQTEQQSATPLLRKKKNQQVCVSKLWAGKNYDHAQQKLRQHRKDILQVQICSGTQGYTQEFKQIFYSQKCMQVNKCSKEPLNDPKFSWIHYNRTETGLYWPIYCTVCVFIVDQTEDLLKYWHEVMTFVNTKDGFHLYISFYSYLCQRVFSATGIITKPWGAQRGLTGLLWPKMRVAAVG